MKLYAFSNELLGENGDDFDNALMDIFECETEAECEAKFNEIYDTNDYTYSYTAPTNGDLFGRIEQ